MRESSTTRALITKRQPIAASTCLCREIMKKLNLDFLQLAASTENFLCTKRRALGRSWDFPQSTSARKRLPCCSGDLPQ